MPDGIPKQLTSSLVRTLATAPRPRQTLDLAGARCQSSPSTFARVLAPRRGAGTAAMAGRSPPTANGKPSMAHGCRGPACSNLAHHPGVLHLRILEDLVELVDRPGGEAPAPIMRWTHSLTFAPWPARPPRAALEGWMIFDTRRVRGEQRVGDQRLVAQHAAELLRTGRD